jgi:hypothetical protein
MTPEEFQRIQNREVYEDEIAFATLKSRHEREMTRILALHPALANPVPPAPIERVNGSFTMKVSEVWGELVEEWRSGTWRLPVADSTGDLAGPFRGNGYCLEPIRQAGFDCYDWYDSRVPARDGDLVLVQWYPAALQAMIERNQHKPEWIATYGEKPGPLATKVLKRFANDYYLMTNKSMLPLGNNRILGVLAHTGPARTDGATVAHRIAANAATEVIAARDAGPIVESDATSTPSAFDILTAAVTLNNATDRVEVVCSGRMVVEQTAGGTPFDKVILGAAASRPPSQPYDVADSFTIEEEGSFNFALAGSFTTLSNQTGSYQFGLRLGIFNNGSGITTECTFTDVNVSVSVYKR